jgi:hypothetical protein
LVIADESSGVSSSDSLESNISIININNNYETESTETGKESTNKEMTEGTYGRGWRRGRKRGRGHGHPRSSRHGLQIKPKPIWVQIECKPFVFYWERENDCVGPHIRTMVKMTASNWFFKFFTHNIINNMMRHTNEYATNKEVNQ